MEHRIERIGALMREKIGELILSGKIKDPRVDTFLSVTRVDVSRDLSCADVFVSSYKTEEGLGRGVAGLQSAAGFIQAQLALIMHIRSTPRLRFHADLGIREGFDMIRKIDALVEHGGENAHNGENNVRVPAAQ
ncbi:MAG: 30S ribosome-binding factor RbfA [Treponema sp.]|jgi:ribosome-binding factor A|nr:30S ribosome-binding factor RbfA [Treponema sp.]